MGHVDTSALFQIPRTSENIAHAKVGMSLLDGLLGDQDPSRFEDPAHWQRFSPLCICLAAIFNNLVQFIVADTPESRSAFLAQCQEGWRNAELYFNNPLRLPAGQRWLRSYVDMGVAKEVFRRLMARSIQSATEHREREAAWSRELTSVLLHTVPPISEQELAAAILEGCEGSRSVLLALAETAFEKAEYDQAIACAERALAINAVCPDSQQLLYQALIAKRAAGEPAEHDGISLTDLSDRFCSRPFTTLATGHEGFSFLCDCPAYLPFPSGNVLEDDGADAVWNSDAAQEIRRSILDGDFSYCSRSLCGLIREGLLPQKEEIKDEQLRHIIENRITRLDRAPISIQLSHDQSCNLACPSCRTEVRVLKGSEQGPYMRSLESVVLPLLERSTGNLMISGGGDPFASKFYRSVLESLNRERFPKLRVAILTNGLLLTPGQWNAIHAAQPMIASLLVSVDAATPQTYADVRRPGDFSKLLPNLEFLAKVRRTERQTDLHLTERQGFRFFGLCFVVQERNFREMPEFVALGRRLGVDCVWFQRIVNFGSFTPAELQEADVVWPDHPHHAEYLRVLEHPYLKDPIVKLFGQFVNDTTLDPGYHDRYHELRERAIDAKATGDDETYENLRIELEGMI